MQFLPKPPNEEPIALPVIVNVPDPRFARVVMPVFAPVDPFTVPTTEAEFVLVS
jgi:hypothetical protein